MAVSRSRGNCNLWKYTELRGSDLTIACLEWLTSLDKEYFLRHYLAFIILYLLKSYLLWSFTGLIKFLLKKYSKNGCLEAHILLWTDSTKLFKQLKWIARRDLKFCTLCGVEENDWDSRPVKGAQRIEKGVQKGRWKNAMYWNSFGPQGERRRNFLSLYSMTLQGQRHRASYK